MLIYFHLAKNEINENVALELAVCKVVTLV